MTRRLLPTLLALGAGFVLLVAGLAALQRIFARERDDAREALVARRAALSLYASETLRQALREKLLQALPRIGAARENPLVDVRGILSMEGGRVLVPPAPVAPLPGDAAPAKALYEAVLAGRASRNGSRERRAEDDSGALAERLRLLERLSHALRARDRDAVESTVRGILSHRVRRTLPAEQEIPTAIAMVRLLLTRSHPDPSLLRGVLRDGVNSASGNRLEGLQRLLLRKQAQLTRPDIDFLARELVSLSEAGSVRHDDFELRLLEPPPPPRVPERLPAPALVPGWYFHPNPDGTVLGVAVAEGPLLLEIAADMRSRALLEEADRLALPPIPRTGLLVSRFDVRVSSPLLDERLPPRIDHGFALKTGLSILCGCLGLALAGLGALLQERKQRYLALQSEFVSAVSHELKTPLASVRLMAETLERRLAEAPAARDYPTRIVAEVDRLSFLVDNVLSFGRLEKGRWRLNLAPVHLASLAGELRTSAATHTGKPVTLQVEGLDEAPLLADADLLYLLLSNLFRNSCRYNSRPEVSLRLRATRRGRDTVLLFEDNGDGIPREAWTAVFDEFFRLGSLGREGTGLGLAICQRVMALHGGSIRVAASGPAGTTFEMIFPGGAA